MGKAMDDKIIAAATGSSLTGKAGATSTALPSGNVIAHGSADLTIAKLISAKEILDAADVDPEITRYIAVSPAQISALLGTTQVTSSDFNTVKALSQGTVDTFLGFKFVLSNRLAKSVQSDLFCLGRRWS